MPDINFWGGNCQFLLFILLLTHFPILCVVLVLSVLIFCINFSLFLVISYQDTKNEHIHHHFLLFSSPQILSNMNPFPTSYPYFTIIFDNPVSPISEHMYGTTIWSKGNLLIPFLLCFITGVFYCHISKLIDFFHNLA